MITKSDFIGINTHGFEYVFDPHGWVDIDFPCINICVTKRNFYCDRGRYGFLAQVKEECINKMTIDFSDGFPRYFFSLQRAFDEMKDWVDFRKNQIYDKK